MHDFVYTYSEFPHPSWCHVRILDERDRPITVLCSQMFDNRGCSVTNAIKDIRRAVLASLEQAQPSPVERARAALLKPTPDTAIDAAVAACGHSGLGLLSAALKLGWRVLSEERDAARRIANVTWVEHYPNGTLPSLFRHDKHALVTFDRTSGQPGWEHVDARAIAERTGYSVRQLTVPRDRLVRP